MENALRQSEEKHRSILKNMEEGYYEVDLKGTFTYANAATCRNLGHTAQTFQVIPIGYSGQNFFKAN